ncbi:MAG: SdpI family protein [Actinomyces succiniciruminis]|nr:SdpI family protein [Actinomyces succiniciruminis]
MADFLASVLLAVACAIGGLLVTIIAAKMKRGTLKPNSFAGVRIPRAYRSEEDWYQIQSASANATLLMGFIFFDCAVLFLIQALLPEIVPFMFPCVVFVLQSILGIALIWYAALTADRYSAKR